MTKDKRKLKAQVKSRWYYIFWGTATISVVLGQLYIGTGYYQMSNKVNNILEQIK